MAKKKPVMDQSQPWWALLFSLLRIEKDVGRIADAQEGLYVLAKAEAARKAEIAKGFSLGGTGGLLRNMREAKEAIR